MILVERHQIKPDKDLLKQFFFSKNLYNSAIYILRQNLFDGGTEPVSYVELYHRLKSTEDYKALHSKVAQQTIIKAQKAMKGFFEATKSYERSPEKFLSEPRPPKYKDKADGQFMLIYTMQAVSKKALDKGFVSPARTSLRLSTRKENIREVRIIPHRKVATVEVVYEVEEKPLNKNENYLSIDLGVNNVASATSNKLGFEPILVNGRPLKSINQFYNKKKSQIQSELGEVKSSNKLRKLTRKRNNKVNDYLHKASRKIIDLCESQDIVTVIIGKNEYWKQNVHLGKRTNQNFVQIPFNRLISMLEYKGKLIGISVITSEESYTSKCSFLDGEDICFHEKYAGKRIKRGLFQTLTGKLINADINGSYNILRKVVPNAFSNGIEAVVVQPRPLQV